MALHFLSKLKILVVRDIEREDIEFICKVRHRTYCLSVLITAPKNPGFGHSPTGN